MSTGQMQQRNAQNVRLLSGDFQLRYEPNFAWKSACSAFLALPALRAFWPMSSVDYAAADRARDLSGQGYHLTDNNTVEFGHDALAPYAHFTSASSQALTRLDGGVANWADVTGTETYVESAYRGLTFGGWFYFDNAAGSTEVMIAKANSTSTIAGISYIMFRQVGGTIRVRTSNGVAVNTVSSTVAPAQVTWFFSVGRFDPSTTQDVFTDGAIVTLGAGVNASIQDTDTNFAIGALSNLSGNFMDGRASMCFLCAAQLSDGIILSLFHQTRAMYGV